MGPAPHPPGGTAAGAVLPCPELTLLSCSWGRKCWALGVDLSKLSKHPGSQGWEQRCWSPCPPACPPLCPWDLSGKVGRPGPCVLPLGL